MTNDIEEKTKVSVAEKEVEVLGGKFTIKEIFLESGQTEEDVLSLISSTPTDRWFVMLSEGEEMTEDVLSIIDDQFEFQSVALGILENE